jgi:ABC-type multidrug transport system ATPase subunit
MEPLLSLRRVRKSHWRGPHEILVLEEVSFDVHAGEVLAVWGRRGAGKTTLALVSAGLETPDGGTVMFDGADLGASGRRSRRLREGIGWMQRGGPASGDLRTVLDYAALPLLGAYSPRGARRRASAVLRKVGVGDCADARWESLTDGERTLVALAHALVREPRLLIADDPTSNLDVIQRERVMGLLRRAADQEGLGILLTVPDMPDVAAADRIGSLSDGRLSIVGGTPEDHANVIAFPGREQLG